MPLTGSDPAIPPLFSLGVPVVQEVGQVSVLSQKDSPAHSLASHSP